MYIIMLAVLIFGIMKYISGVKKNLYEYENIRLLGLIIFIGLSLVWQTVFFIDDLRHPYEASVYMFVQNIQSNVAIFSIFMFPVVIITSVLVTISNLVLIKKEGKTWRNMLGLFLGGFISVSTVFLMLGVFMMKYSTDISAAVIHYLMNVYAAFIVYLECVLFGTIIMGIVSAKHIPRYDKDYMIILGSRIKSDGTLTPLLRSRVDKAVEFAGIQEERTGKAPALVVSGGKGEDEVTSEAEAMKEYLLSCRIDEDRILTENRSKSTDENIRFSAELIRKENGNAKMAFSTTNYHVFRTGVIAAEQGFDMEGIGANTKTYFWINAFIREFIATLVAEKKKHLIALAVFAVFTLIIEIYIHHVWLR